MQKIDFKQLEKELEEIRDEVVKKELEEFKKEGFAYNVYQSDVLGNSTGPAIGGMYDICGGAYIYFRDKRSSFYKQYKSYLKSLPENKDDKWFEVTHFYYPCSGRQELCLNAKLARCCCEHINKKYNAGCGYRTFVD